MKMFSSPNKGNPISLYEDVHNIITSDNDKKNTVTNVLHITTL